MCIDEYQIYISCFLKKNTKLIFWPSGSLKKREFSPKYVARKRHHMNNAIIPKPLVEQGQEFSCAEMNMKSKFYGMQMEE